MGRKTLKIVRQQANQIQLLNGVIDAALEQAWQMHREIFKVTNSQRMTDELQWKDALLAQWVKTARLRVKEAKEAQHEDLQK
jgi:hypothetical protein